MKFNFPPECTDHLHRIIVIKEMELAPGMISTFSIRQAAAGVFETELMQILTDEFPESSVGTLYSGMIPVRVIIFEDAADTLAFSLKYGYLYARKIT